MNRSMIVGIAIGVGVAATGAAVAGFGFAKRTPTYADVLDVRPVHRTQRTPHESCADVSVERQRPVKDEHRVAGTAIGAVLGGVIGHQIGGGTGRDLATVAGAAAGGYAGNRVQKEMQERDTYQATEQRCRTVEETKQTIVGYDVRYRIGDTVDTIRLKDKPGDRLPVRDGKIVADGVAGDGPQG